MSNEIYRIKVLIPYWDKDSPKPAEYSPYRIIDVKHNTILSDFAKTAITAFDFELNCPFGFYDNKKRYYSAKKGYVMRFEDDDEWNTFDQDNIFGDVDKATIEGMLTHRGKKWLLLYDYIREWNFLVSLIDRIPADPKEKYPRIVESHMKAPIQSEKLAPFPIR